MESVSSMITASRFTDSDDPEPLSPLLMSDTAGDHERRAVRILGPAAPILPRTKAPPIHRRKGPNSRRSALTMKLEMIPPDPYGPHPPLDWIQLSK